MFRMRRASSKRRSATRRAESVESREIIKNEEADDSRCDAKPGATYIGRLMGESKRPKLRLVFYKRDKILGTPRGLMHPSERDCEGYVGRLCFFFPTKVAGVRKAVQLSCRI